MLVRDVMTRDPITVAPDTAVRQARLLAQQQGVRHLPVVHHRALIGMMTRRELVDDTNDILRAAAGFPDSTPGAGGQRVRAVMQPAYPVVRPDMTVESAARLLLIKGRSGVAVLDEQLHLVGILTTTDLLAAAMHTTPETADLVT